MPYRHSGKNVGWVRMFLSAEENGDIHHLPEVLGVGHIHYTMWVTRNEATVSGLC